MSAPERIVVALDALPLAGPRTGAGVCCGQLLRGLAGRSDVEVTAFAVARRARAIAPRVPAGVPFRAVAMPTRMVHALWGTVGIPSAEGIARRASLVHGTNFVVPPTRTMAAVVTVNDVSPWKYPELCAPASLAYPKLVLRAVQRGAFVHTAAHQVAGELSELISVRLESIRVIPYGLAPAAAPASPEAADKAEPRAATEPSPAAGRTPAGEYVLAVSTIEPRKDYPTLVKAFAEVAGAHPRLRLVIAGAEGRGSPALDEAVVATGMDGRVVRLGYVSDDERSRLLRGARAFAYPSRYEGFGFPPLEAMEAGVPGVVTAAGAVPEVVGDAALVVPVGDVGSLAGAIERLLSDEELRSSLAAKGKARAGCYSWARTAAEMAAFYTEVVEAGR